ncbi:MAG TPA: xanthine dehydrogenase family protein molybdopterin-binding subunit [Sphingomonas sp.]|nr:xanthine dehydrogenase family protein molybdopterin-binding subunit [Sphingomonas sp.]
MATTAPSRTSRIGEPLRRVDGPVKTTGRARYAAEFPAESLLYGVAVSSAIAQGRIAAIRTARAEAAPGVVLVMTHENAPPTADSDKAWADQIAPKGAPFRPLGDDRIRFSQQPVALVVAESFEAARHAARLVEVDYEVEPPVTDFAHAALYDPKGDGNYEPSPRRGDARAAYDAAPHRVSGRYRLATEHHNPIEPHAAMAEWRPDGSLVVHDKTQGVKNPQTWLAKIFGLEPEQVRAINPYMGAAFGSGLRPQYQLFLAAAAAKLAGRPVKVVLTRQQMFSHQHRPAASYDIALAADERGRLVSILSDGVSATSRFESYAENIVDWGPRLYACPNAEIGYKLAPLNIYTPGPMRAPGAATGLNLFEIAMDELACEVGVDPLELRLINYSDKDQITGRPYTSKALREAYAQGAERFGWAKRSREPRSMRDGRELVGWGMATGMWDTLFMPHSVRARLGADGRLEVATASADIGTGTYTIMAQIASEEMGLPVDRIDPKLGDSALPQAPVEGGSWTAASVGTALQLACRALQEKLLAAARGIEGSPFANAAREQVVFDDGALRLKPDPTQSIALEEIVRRSGEQAIEAEETGSRDLLEARDKARNTHQAVFAEVKVDEELGQVRVTRVVVAAAAGRIINPATARSQILGGVVMGIGMALTEETMMDHRLGRFMNHNLAEYHVPAHADIADIEVIFVDEPDRQVNPIGVKGLGEIGIVGAAAAVANAIYHATGKRVRDLPITIDKLL